MRNASSVTLFQSLEILKAELLDELNRNNHFWLETVVNDEGYCGQVSANGICVSQADKGVILATRMLWYFSEATMYLDDFSLHRAADKIYSYICNHFIDSKAGGVYWMVSCDGQIKDDRKQVYAQAFAIYAFSAYFRLSRNLDALNHARSIFDLLEAHALDKVHGGYLEAFSCNWQICDDIRLSPKDLPSPKTMNTHLHLLEAYTGLLRAEVACVSNPRLVVVKSSLTRLLFTYKSRFFDGKHLRMFLGKSWADESLAYSYGHEIESSWLIWEAVAELNTPEIASQFLPVVEALACTTAAEGLTENGESVYDMYEIEQARMEKARIWWVQAEAMVGFFNAWQITDNDQYLNYVLRIWGFIKRELMDIAHGEWYWTAKVDIAPQASPHYKVGPWKGPYHNGRALLELCRRIESICDK